MLISNMKVLRSKLVHKILKKKKIRKLNHIPILLILIQLVYRDHHIVGL